MTIVNSPKKAKTRICMVFASLKNSNGVSKAAIAIANILSVREDLEITLIPLYECEERAMDMVSKRVKIEKVFGFYFTGFDKLIDKIPHKWLYNAIIKSGRYDVEIGFQFNNPTTIIASSTNKNATHIAWMHGYDYKLKLRNAYSAMDKVICVSRCNSERLLKEMDGNVVTDYCYNIVDDEKVREKGRDTIDVEKHDGIQLVTVGRHSPEKGYGRLLEILSRLKEDGYTFGCWFVGNGPSHNELLEKSKALGLDDVVTFMGDQINPHKYTSRGDLFVCSSFSEGYSTACTEAVMLGIPVITTAVSGGEEIIKDCEAGLVTGLDNESLYQGLKKVLDNPETVSTWKETLSHTKERFSQKERIKKLNEVVDWAIELHHSKSVYTQI